VEAKVEGKWAHRNLLAGRGNKARCLWYANDNKEAVALTSNVQLNVVVGVEQRGCVKACLFQHLAHCTRSVALALVDLALGKPPAAVLPTAHQQALRQKECVCVCEWMWGR